MEAAQLSESQMDREREIVAIRARLARLDIAKAELEASLSRLLATQEIEDRARLSKMRLSPMRRRLPQR